MAETTEPKPEDKTKVLAKVETSVCGLVLHTLEDMTTVAQIILQSGIAPDSFKTKEQIFVGLQAGAEVGLKPMQALNSIVVIKNKPTLWGDAALALVKRSGLSEYCKEYFELAGKEIPEKDIQYTDIKDYPDDLVAVCETKAKRDPEPVIRYFSVADAKLAKLWGKKTKAGGPLPWSTHPKRMLKYKARAFNLRDNFPDVLFGMHLTEEMVGEEPLPAPESDVLPRGERRMAVPSSTVDTTRAPVVTGVRTEPVIDGQEPSRAPVQEQQPELTPESKERIAAAADGETVPVEEEKPLVTFVCKECGQTFLYGKEEGKGKPCSCGKGLLVEALKQPEPAEHAGDEDKKPDDVKTLYVDVNGMYIAQGGGDFIAFAAYVLCIDESEVNMGNLTAEQLKQVKAYIETSGIEVA